MDIVRINRVSCWMAQFSTGAQSSWLRHCLNNFNCFRSLVAWWWPSLKSWLPTRSWFPLVPDLTLWYQLWYCARRNKINTRFIDVFQRKGSYNWSQIESWLATNYYKMDYLTFNDRSRYDHDRVGHCDDSCDDRVEHVGYDVHDDRNDLDRCDVRDNPCPGDHGSLRYCGRSDLLCGPCDGPGVPYRRDPGRDDRGSRDALPCGRCGGPCGLYPCGNRDDRTGLRGGRSAGFRALRSACRGVRSHCDLCGHRNLRNLCSHRVCRGLRILRGYRGCCGGFRGVHGSLRHGRHRGRHRSLRTIPSQLFPNPLQLPFQPALTRSSACPIPRVSVSLQWLRRRGAEPRKPVHVNWMKILISKHSYQFKAVMGLTEANSQTIFTFEWVIFSLPRLLYRFTLIAIILVSSYVFASHSVSTCDGSKKLRLDAVWFPSQIAWYLYARKGNLCHRFSTLQRHASVRWVTYSIVVYNHYCSNQ